MAHKLSLADRNDFVTGKRHKTIRPLKNLVMFIIPRKTMGFFTSKALGTIGEQKNSGLISLIRSDMVEEPFRTYQI